MGRRATPPPRPCVSPSSAPVACGEDRNRSPSAASLTCWSRVRAGRGGGGGSRRGSGAMSATALTSAHALGACRELLATSLSM
eukprot:scaffold35950_cov90-Isochrysis_galbana.AAC.1